MIQMYLTKTLARDLSIHVRDGIDYGTSNDDTEGAMQWYAHEVVVKGSLCVFTMELQSRYVMVFCGLTKTDLLHFPEIFQDRLWGEVTSICADADEDVLSMVSDVVLNQAVEQLYCTGYNASVNAHISQVAQNLEMLVMYDGFPLPVKKRAAFEFSIHQNDTIRKCKGSEGYFNPLELFRQYWYDLAENTEKNMPLNSIPGLKIPGFSETELNATQKSVTHLDDERIAAHRKKRNDESSRVVGFSNQPHPLAQWQSSAHQKINDKQVQQANKSDADQDNLKSNVVTVDFKKRR